MRVVGGREAPPAVWLMLSHRAGDSTQVLALAEALGCDYEINPHLRDGAPAAKEAWARRWPDLVISAGWRSELRAQRLRNRAARDGWPVRLVHVGRPWFSRNAFDLVVTPPQYRLPLRDHILQNKTPLHAVTEERLAEAAEQWAPRFAQLPRPFVSVLVGGHSGPFNFDRQAAERLVREASRFATELGGSLLVTTSARTPRHVTEMLETQLSVPHYLHKWRAGGDDNPYYALLALGDHIVATCDSVSMLTEACATRKPVHIFDIGEVGAADGTGADGRRWALGELGRLRSYLYQLFLRFGPKRVTRDIKLVHRYLLESGRAVRLGERVRDWREPAPLDSVPRAVDRVRNLIGAPAMRWQAKPSLSAPRPSRREAS